MSDIVRVMRLIIYEGPREAVEDIIKRSVHGTRPSYSTGKGVAITATTLNEFPEIIRKHEEIVNYPDPS